MEGSAGELRIIGKPRRRNVVLELHDLWVSKAVAGRRKGIEFCVAFLERGLVDPDVLRERLAGTHDLPDGVRDRIRKLIDRSSDS